MTVNSGAAFGTIPCVRIFRDGGELPPSECLAGIKTTVSDDMDGVDDFQIDFSLGDGGEPNRQLLSADKWSPGRKVTIAMGYADHQMRNLIDGMVTATARVSLAPGPPVLRVFGRGMIGALHKTPRTRAFANMTDNEIARFVAREAGFPIDAPHRSGTTDVKWDHVIQDNLTDLAFLRRRARRCGCVMTTVPSGGGQERRLYFGPSPDPEPVHAFTFGKDLHHFNPTLDTAGQVGEVVVQGWNAIRGERIVATAKRSAADFSGVMAMLDAQASSAFKHRRDVLTAVAPNAETAEALARGVMANLARRMATAEGSCAGLPLLTVGARIKISGFETWSDGLWVTSAVTHELGFDGYRTTFRCYRDPH